MSVKLCPISKAEFEAWLATRKGTHVGRANRAGWGPLELFYSLTNPKLTHVTIAGSDIWYTENGSPRKLSLPRWACRFQDALQYMPEEARGNMPTVTYTKCIETLNNIRI